VYVILKDGLQRIHEALSCDQMSARWPTESKLQLLSHRIGGLPVLAEVHC
jgi:hypothetical protein